MTLVEAVVELVLADLEYLWLLRLDPKRLDFSPTRFRPKTKKMMTPCETLGIFNMICKAMGTSCELPSGEINHATTSKTQVRPKATKSFKNVLIL